MRTLVLLTSVALDEASWQWLDLPRGVRVAMPTYPGHTASGVWEPGIALAEVADMIAGSCPGGLDVAGISLGGIVAQHLAVRHPDRVRSLLIAGTTARSEPATMLARAEAAEEGLTEDEVARTLARWFTPAALARVPQHPGVAYARRRLGKIGGRTFGAAWRAMAQHDLRGRLRGVGVPVTVLAGELDEAAPVAAVRDLAAEFPHAHVQVLPTPHLVQLECPEVFSEALRDHLELGEVAS